MPVFPPNDEGQLRREIGRRSWLTRDDGNLAREIGDIISTEFGFRREGLVV